MRKETECFQLPFHVLKKIRKIYSLSVFLPVPGMWRYIWGGANAVSRAIRWTSSPTIQTVSIAEHIRKLLC